MARFPVRMGVLALSALLSGTALADAPDEAPPAATLVQSLDGGIRDAQAKRSQHDYAGAVRILSQLMLVAPDDPRVVGEYGKVLVQQGRSREAVDFLTRATQLQPGDWTYYSALGIAYDQTGDYASARGAYERALVLKPGDAVVLNNFAMSRMLAGDLAQARKLIAQAATGSKDEQIARNLKLIDGLPQPVVAATAPARSAPVATPAKAPTSVAQQPPHPLPAVGTVSPAAPQVVIQAVPTDTKAGKIAKPVHTARSHAKPASVAVSKPATLAAGTLKPSIALKPDVGGTAPVTVGKNMPKPAVKGATPVTVVKNAPASNSGIPALRLANDRP